MNLFGFLGIGAVAVVANATMDELRFHWDRFFGKIAKPGTKLEKWMNPAISWWNKYKFKSEVLNYLYGSVCVWLTDFWHLLKSIYLNALFSIIILLMDPIIDLKSFIVTLALLHLFWGFWFQFTFGIYGGLSRLFKNKK